MNPRPGPDPSVVASDGGSAEFTERADDLADDVEDDELAERYDDAEIIDDDRPDECDCLPTFEDLPCFACYQAGFTTPNPSVDGE
jgi:hypothetical protein